MELLFWLLQKIAINAKNKLFVSNKSPRLVNKWKWYFKLLLCPLCLSKVIKDIYVTVLNCRGRGLNHMGRKFFLNIEVGNWKWHCGSLQTLEWMGMGVAVVRGLKGRYLIRRDDTVVFLSWNSTLLIGLPSKIFL